MTKLSLADGRILLLVSLDEAAEILSFRDGDFALLLRGEDAGAPIMAPLLELACTRRCLGFSTVGPGAEALHDAIDEVIIAHDQGGLPTTWNNPGPDAVEDACWYFIHLAGPDAPILIAVIGDDATLRAGLEAAMADPP